jgi:phosphoribosylglycinamide formyltransferase-1
MYGMHVHRAVLDSGQRYSGITIHLVDREYDTGPILAQYRCDINAGDTLQSLADRIHTLEHAHYPDVVASWVEGWTGT